MLKKLVLLFLAFFLFWNLAFSDYKNVSPVVQIISFSDTNWKQPYMLWWWSASIINDKWIIISNNHVVDKWNWALASAFLVCMTEKVWEKPVCSYTADLINRDEKMDISILKIRDKDIYWNSVDYANFKSIKVNFDYEAKNQDEVVAIGYPWVWADTITETKWIVSGVSEYNFFKYIKTDALIAWWNSGWALINSAWELIWIPTFWIGGWWENSLWYALSIEEAKEFITTNLDIVPEKNYITEVIDFSKYRKTIEDINKNKKVEDDAFSVNIPENYELKNYYKNESVEIGQKKAASSLLNMVSIKVASTKTFKDDKEFFYFLESTWFYSKEYNKLLKRNISQIDFYYSVAKDDLTNWDYWGNYYIWYSWNKLITISIDAPFYDEVLKKDLKKELNNILANISFKKDNFKNIKYDFSFSIPKVSIKNVSKSVSNNFDYSIYFASNLYEKMTINLFDLYWEYEGKWKTVKEIYDISLQNVNDSKKSMIKFKWLEWFYFCNDSNDWYYWYNPYPYSYYNYSVDENWNNINLSNCNIKIFFPLNEGLNRQSYLNIDISWKKENIEKYLTFTLGFLSKYVNLEGSWETDLVNIFKVTSSKLNFSDIWDQTEWYKKFLQLLVKYSVLENKSKFLWERPVKRWEFAYMTSKYVFKINLEEKSCKKEDYKCIFSKTQVTINDKKVSLDKVFKDLWVKYDEYVDLNKSYSFGTYLGYKLAWLNIWEFTTKNISKFERLQTEKIYAKEKDKLDKFYNNIYWTRKISYLEIDSWANIYYEKEKVINYYSKIKKLIWMDSVLDEKISMSFEDSNSYKDYINSYEPKECLNLANNFAEYKKCEKENEEWYKKAESKMSYFSFYPQNDYSYTYSVMQKADMFQIIFEQVDFAMFDEKFAKKKDVTIEEAK